MAFMAFERVYNIPAAIPQMASITAAHMSPTRVPTEDDGRVRCRGWACRCCCCGGGGGCGVVVGALAAPARLPPLQPRSACPPPQVGFYIQLGDSLWEVGAQPEVREGIDGMQVVPKIVVRERAAQVGQQRARRALRLPPSPPPCPPAQPAARHLPPAAWAATCVQPSGR
jgi:hypothetical protein